MFQHTEVFLLLHFFFFARSQTEILIVKFRFEDLASGSLLVSLFLTHVPDEWVSQAQVWDIQQKFKGITPHEVRLLYNF